MKTIGPFRPDPKGAYSALTEYSLLDWVTDSGNSYLYINETPSTGTALSTGTHWLCIAQKGDTFSIGGDWDAGTEYEFWDIALHEGSSYVYINATASTGNEPPNATYWQLLAQGAEAYTDPSTLDWDDIQRVVRLGDTDKIFVVGDQLQTTHSTYTSIVWDVVGITDADHTGFDPADTAYFTKYPDAKPMLLLMNRVIYGRQFDNIEALYACAAGLPAGTYNFALPAGYEVAYGGGLTYQFTLSSAVPAGGVIMFPWGNSVQASTIQISSYSTQISTSAIESVAVTAGSNGTALGTADGLTANMNHAQRIRFGSNNWSQSAVRQWLNSAAAANAWWTPQTIFDRPPTYANVAGFLNGLDADFVAILGETDHVTVNNTVTDGGGVYVTRDKIYLPSRTEIFGSNEVGGTPEGEQYPFYVGSVNADRIKYDISSPATARIWWVRSPDVSNAYYARYVLTSGALTNYGGAHYGYGAAAACVIL